jgi:hypothetical protein
MMSKYVHPMHPEWLVYVVLNGMQQHIEGMADTQEGDLDNIISTNVRSFQDDLVKAQKSHREEAEFALEASDKVAKIIYDNFGQLEDPLHYQSIAMMLPFTDRKGELRAEVTSLLRYEESRQDEVRRLKDFADTRISQLQAFDDWQKGGGYKSIEFAYQNLSKYRRKLYADAKLGAA